MGFACVRVHVGAYNLYIHIFTQSAPHTHTLFVRIVVVVPCKVDVVVRPLIALIGAAAAAHDLGLWLLVHQQRRRRRRQRRRHRRHRCHCRQRRHWRAGRLRRRRRRRLERREFRRPRERRLDAVGEQPNLLRQPVLLAVLLGAREEHLAQVHHAEDGNDGDGRPDQAGLIVELVVQQLADGLVLLHGGDGFGGDDVVGWLEKRGTLSISFDQVLSDLV